MAGIFQSFRSSAMPKRLLRYAMARFDIFEDDALDLENLDLGFGLRTTFEFKDVGLKVEKISKQLALPPGYRIKKAKVSRLQLTVPLDLYSSSIELTAVGVHICLQISSTEDPDKDRSRKDAKKRQDADSVPTAADLAQSFLETQPIREKKALEDALAAEQQDLGASVALSEDSSEDDIAYGTGQGLSLPVFMTDFLQGIVDRTQVTVRDVTFYLDIEVPVEPKSAETELVTFQVSLEELNIEGVTTQARKDTEDAARIVPKEGKRQILLNNIRASIISEGDLFSTLARSPSMASAALRSPVLTERSRPSGQEPNLGRGFLGDSSADAGDDSDSSQPLQDSEIALQIPYELGEPSSTRQTEEQERQAASSLSTPKASVYHDLAGQYPGASAHSPLAESPLFICPSSLQQPTANQERFSGELSLGQSVSSDSVREDSRAQPEEDLAQSRLFSQDEAESMYMSAFSESESQRLRGGRMPGAWDYNPTIPENFPDLNRAVPVPSPGSPGHCTGMKTQEKSTPLQEVEPPTPTQPTVREGVVAYPGTAQTDLPESTHEPSAEVTADEAGTPSPTRLVKEIVSLKSISVYVPTKHRHIQVSSLDGTQMTRSNLYDVPGAFSVHLPSSSIHVQHHHDPEVVETDNDDGSIEVNFAPLEVRFDTSVGFMLVMVAQRLLDASKGSRQPPEEVSASEKLDVSRPRIKFSAQKISVLFLERLFGVAGTTARASSSTTTDEALLRTDFEQLRATVSRSSSVTETHISIEKFRFGYHDSDILSFDREAQMRASVRDAFPEAGADISVNLSSFKDTSRCEVYTLPLRVHMDLQRLDETFSWFGGLSGFLQMGASMTSSGSQAKQTAKPAKLRGVRFDIPAQSENTVAASENKTDVRIGGLQLDLVGKVCGIRLRTTAVKVVSREGIVGIGISKIHVSGPSRMRDSDGPPIDIVLSNTRLDYFLSPRDDDLDRLLALIVPSKGQFDDNDGEIMVDTLLRQRRKGSVLKLSFDDVQAQITNLQQLDSIPALGEELARLGTVAKYLPEDDRPGLLTLGLIHNLQVSVDVGGRFGTVNTQMADFELAHVTFPSLAAFGINSVKVDRDSIEELIGSSSGSKTGLMPQSPVLMVRVIGDEMEPAIKVRMRNINFEYRVPTVMDILGLSSETTPQEFDAMLAASVANLGEQAHTALVGGQSPQARQSSAAPRAGPAKPTVVSVAFRDCMIGLNPLSLTSKLVVVLIDTKVEVALPTGEDVNATADLNKAAILLVDDTLLLESTQRPGPSRHRGSDVQRQTDIVSTLCSKGYVNICQISAARATVQVTTGVDGEKQVDAELRDDLLVLQTCADSFHTLIALSGALKPPTPPSKEVKYKTKVIPVQDMLASITADAFGSAEGDYNFDDDFAHTQELGGGDDSSEGELVSASPLGIESQFYAGQPVVAENIFDATSSSIISDRTTTQKKSHDAFSPKAGPYASRQDIGSSSELEIHENYFGANPLAEGTAHRWSSARNKYDESDETKVPRSPLNVRVRDVHIIWQLFDGYDWQHTRDAITKTVEEVESKAFERRARSSRRSMEESLDLEDQDVVGDCLFNSIYVSIPANHDPRELVRGINHQLNDTESIATTTVTTTTTRTGAGEFRSRSNKLRLKRSKQYKIVFELQGVNVDLVGFPPGSGETDTSIDVRVHNLEVFDHVPTSTWKKFATYDLDAGERELGTSMVHLEVLLVKPVTEVSASEFVLKATVLPLRLHVDQDALEFIQRFFQFKDESQQPSQSSPSDEAFIQRAEINSIPVALDFKPKRVDYAGLRGGRTSEFMNFVILESARLTLRHTIVYGTTGWERLGNTLNDIWTPDVKRTQLAGVLAGVAPVRHLVNVGSGFRDLIEIPIKEYKKDGRIVRSIGKGAAAFARTTGTEIVKLGAKMAIGTQYVLQGAEGMLIKNSGEGSSGGGGGVVGEASSIQTGWEEEEMEAEEKKQISLYADQPTGVIQGLRHAYSSLARDLNVARDAVIAVPAEVMESRNAQGAARAVMKRAPTIIFRPAIGATRAVGQALMGATNALDPDNLRRAEDKYKPGPGR